MSSTTIGAYDTVCMLKAGVEKAQSIDPKAVAAAMRLGEALPHRLALVTSLIVMRPPAGDQQCE